MTIHDFAFLAIARSTAHYLTLSLSHLEWWNGQRKKYTQHQANDRPTNFNMLSLPKKIMYNTTLNKQRAIQCTKLGGM